MVCYPWIEVLGMFIKLYHTISIALCFEPNTSVLTLLMKIPQTMRWGLELLHFELIYCYI